MPKTADEVIQSSACQRFIDQARTAAAIVHEIESYEQAVAYTVDLCEKHELSRVSISEADPYEGAEKTVAAPSLTSEEYTLLVSRCQEKGIVTIDSGMRHYLAGVDIGLSYADIGIAETGTIVISCPDEELRLATMLAERHVCLVPRRRIVADAYEAEPLLQRFMLNTPNYTAFITGPSRTADIERVLAIGVHGPLELHVLVMED
ncbi:MAG: lactate utilization protein [Proteobacteria bacterium]|nr:MAG: lactate utilization protein [Pseudomonadota bacterium]